MSTHSFVPAIARVFTALAFVFAAFATIGAEKAAVAGFELSSPAPESARVYLLSPVHGEKVATTFKVSFGLSGMGVAPAGVAREHTGHHHLLIDLDSLPALDRPLPSSDNIVHFGGGQTETWVTLEPGEHSLQLLLGNHLHVPHNPPVLSQKILITVE